MPINFVFRSYDVFLSSVMEKISQLWKKFSVLTKNGSVLENFGKIFFKFMIFRRNFDQNGNFCEFFINGKSSKNL